MVACEGDLLHLKFDDAENHFVPKVWRDHRQSDPGIDREDLDETLLHMFTKIMVTHNDVLGPRAKLGKPCQFEGTRVVFKNLAIHRRLSAKNLEPDS